MNGNMAAGRWSPVTVDKPSPPPPKGKQWMLGMGCGHRAGGWLGWAGLDWLGWAGLGLDSGSGLGLGLGGEG